MVPITAAPLGIRRVDRREEANPTAAFCFL